MERVIAAEQGKPIEPEISEPYKLHHEVIYALNTWFHHKMHGKYPRAGEYDAQCVFLMADWGTLDLYHLRVEHGITSVINMPDDAPDVLDLMGD